MTERLARALDRVTHVRGVRGALLVGAEDGLVVTETSMEGVKVNAVAALAASLVKRLGRAAEATGAGAPAYFQLDAEAGALLAVPAEEGLLLVTIADAGVNVGLVRLEMLRAVEGMA